MSGKKKDPNTVSVVIDLEKLRKEAEKRGSSQDFKKSVRKALESPALKDAVKSIRDYQKILDEANQGSDRSVLKVLEDLNKQYKPEYGLVSKAVKQLAETQEALKPRGLAAYEDQLKRLRKIENTGNPLKYASEASRLTSVLNNQSLSDFTKRIKENQERIRKVTQPFGIVPANPHKEDTGILTEAIRKRNEEIRKEKEERTERERSIHENTIKQTELQERIASYLVNQSEALDLQKQILEQQLEEIKAQQRENKKTSSFAFWTAIVSIFIGVVIGVASIYITYKVYLWEDISDNKNHRELVQTIEKSTKSNEDLLNAIKQQTESSDKTRKLLEKLLSKPKPKSETPPQSGSGQKSSS